MELRRSHLLSQFLQPLVKYGWEVSNGLLVPIITDNLPSLLALIETSSCGYKKEYLSNMCKCFKNNLVAPPCVNALHVRIKKIIQKKILLCKHLNEWLKVH